MSGDLLWVLIIVLLVLIAAGALRLR